MDKTTIKKYTKLVLNLFISVVFIGIVLFIVPKIIKFFMPFVIGGIIALIANPFVKFLENKLKIKRKAGTVFVIIMAIGLVSAIGYFIIASLIRQSIGFIQSWPELWNGTQQDLKKVVELMERYITKSPINIEETADVVLDRISSGIANAVSISNTESLGNIVGNVATGVINVIMGALSAYFFVAESDYVSCFVKKYMVNNFWNKWDVVMSSMRQAIIGYLKAQFKIEIWIYGILVIGFLILKIDYALLIAFGIAILDFLPVFGTGTVMVPWAIIRFISGDYLGCFGMVIIWGISQFVRQLIQPKIMGDSIGLPAIPTLFLLYIGYKFAGVGGMLLAVPLGMIVSNLNDAGLFDTPKLSLKLLIANINEFRKLTEEDKRVLEQNIEEKEGEKK